MLRVTLEACVSGNPLKAWRGGTEPDDVWESQDHSFADLESAVEFVRSLPEPTTTHVLIQVEDSDGWRTIFHQDAGDDLDSVTLEPPVVVPVDDPDAIPEAPPLVPSQNGGGK